MSNAFIAKAQKFGWQTLNQGKKHSPIILTGVGIVGLGATAYLTYKSADQLHAIVAGMEECRRENQPIPKAQVAKDLGKALWKPAVVGTLSVAAILGSYHILSNRNKILAGALATTSSQLSALHKKIRDEYPEFNNAPVVEEERTGINEEGEEETKVVAIERKHLDSTIGVWYDRSSEYAYDDFGYNRAAIHAAGIALEEKIARRGSITLNDVFSALHVSVDSAEARMGALLGWSEFNTFELEQTVVQTQDGSGNFHPEIYVSWPTPRYIYEDQARTNDLDLYIN